MSVIVLVTLSVPVKLACPQVEEKTVVAFPEIDPVKADDTDPAVGKQHEELPHVTDPKV